MEVIQHFLNNSLRNYNYIVGSDETQEAIFFDPYDISQTLPLCIEKGWKPSYLINTHDHHDHIRNNSEFLALDGTKQVNLLDGEDFLLGANERIVCQFTPGHMMKHDCFFLYQKSFLEGVIVGDTVFNAGIGNCKNGGDVDTLYETIKSIFIPMEDHVKIYPSHDFFMKNLLFAKEVDPSNKFVDKFLSIRKKQNQEEEFINTTIGEERLINPFFRVFQKDFQQKHGKSEKELFLWLRSLRDKW